MAVCNERETELGELAWAASGVIWPHEESSTFFAFASVLQAASPASPPEQPHAAQTAFKCSTDSQSSPYPIYRQAATTTAHLRTQPQRYG